MSQPYGYASQQPYNPHGPPADGPPPAGSAPPPAGGYPNQQGGGFAPPPVPPPMFHGPPGGGYNETHMEQGTVKQDFGFSDQTIRAGFIRKVFTLVTIMLAVVAGMVGFALLHQPTKNFVRHCFGINYVSFAVFLVVYIALMCCESVRRSFPSNLIACAILTLAIGFMTMMISAFYNMSAVLMALGITTGSCAGIIIFAATAKRDLTSCMGIMCILGLVLFFVGIVAIIIMATTGVPWVYLVYSGLAALLFMVYLAIDVQMIMGKFEIRKFEISPEDYIFAAIQVFLDIIYIFWMLVFILICQSTCSYVKRVWGTHS